MEQEFFEHFPDYSASAEAGYSDASDYDSSWNLEQFCNANLLADRHDKSDRYHDGSKSFYTAAGAVQNVPLACAECVIALLPVIVLYILLPTIYYRGTVGLRK